MKFLLWRRQRSRWVSTEWHNHNGVTFINLTVGSPSAHRWWAFSAYLYLRGAS